MNRGFSATDLTMTNGKFSQIVPTIAACLLSFSLLLWHEQGSAQTVPCSIPANLGDLKQQLAEYKRSGAYDRDVAAALLKAEQYVEYRAPLVPKPALVLDIDETSLSNWPEIQANDYGRVTIGACNLPAGPCGQTSWQERGTDEAIAPTLKLFKKAREKGVSVFFITGRSEILRTATEANLRRAGYAGWSAIIMRPVRNTTPSAADYKAPEREKIVRQGFTIIANVGDQPSDLAGGFAERTFLVPNPFYRIP
jgi:predicted secreted acid phosphatase